MKHTTHLLLTALGLPALAAASLQAATLVSDSFAANSHLTQDLANQKSAWYFSAASTNLDDSADGSLKFTTSATSGIQSVVTYFSDTPVSLANNGDSLSVSLKFSGYVTEIGELRLSFFNSGSQRVDADGLGSWNSKFTAYRGYTTYADTRLNSRDPLALLLRNTNDGTIVNGSSHQGTTDTGGNPIPRGGVQSASNDFANNVDYIATYTITRASADTVSITMSLTGGALTGYSYTWTEIASDYANTGLDTFVITTASQFTFDSLTLKQATITFTPAIPESSTTAAMLGVATLALVFGAAVLRRRPTAR
ncbi:hypothetical protein OPIT5_07580 [Opitutaceae bacterium TAV5]|nr:hypothetical protein OPIT5_07580 [Opitutaceae bacterium TAV5]